MTPTQSYLVQKLEGTAAVGERMPLGGEPLPAATLAAIRSWIDAGAPSLPARRCGHDAAGGEPGRRRGRPSSGTVTLTAQASDDVRVVAVEFFVDGVSLGADLSAPYAIVWDTTAASNGPHAL